MKPARSIQLLPWLLLFVLGGALLFLYKLSTQISDDERGRVERVVREAMILDTRINLKVLQLRHQQLLHYDSLVRVIREVDAKLDGLENDFGHLGLRSALVEVHRNWHNKVNVIEDFKRQNAVLANSLYHFVNLSSQLGESASPASRGAALLHLVNQDILTLVNGQQTRPSVLILDGLKRLEKERGAWSAEQQKMVELLVAHARVIMDNHLPVSGMVNTIVQSPISNDLEQAYQEYARVYAAASARAEYFRQWMAGFALVMISVTLLVFLRLQYVGRALLRSHKVLDNVANHLGEGILGFDAQGHLNFLNRRAQLLLERSEPELLGLPLEGILPHDPDAAGLALLEALQQGRYFEGEVNLRRPFGISFPAAFLGGALPGVDGNPAGYVASFRDISLQRQNEARLRLAARVFDSLSEAMALTDAKGLIQFVNPAFTLITGYTEAEAIGRSPGTLLSSGLHDQDFYEEMWIGLRQHGRWQGEIFNRRKNGEIFPEWLSITAVRDDQGEVVQYIALFSDTSERKQAEAHIRHLAYHDPLTGLANRLLFQDRLGHALQQGLRSQKLLAVMLFDLDRFKSINDTLGHAAGDALLRRASERLGAQLQAGDTLARLGGDEFAILLEVASHTEAASVASGLLKEFELPFEIAGREVFVSTSVGIAVSPHDGENPETLLKHAEVALYNAKHAGRGTFRFFLETDSEHTLDRLELETDLRRSVERHELRLHYQLQVNAETGRAHGVEALVRWQHPVRGLLSPDKFVFLAEETGYIDILGRWCLETACAQLLAWQKQGMPLQRVAVNVSARQLRSPGFYEMVMEVLEKTGLPASALEIELTESSLVDNAEETFSLFSRLRSEGVRIAIDDFGTGYSSLSYLSSYPVDVVKIDKSFVQGMGDEPETRSIVQAVTSLAQALSMETIAEGVETEVQHRRLVALKCDVLQGYFFAKPCPAEQLPDLIHPDLTDRRKESPCYPER